MSLDAGDLHRPRLALATATVGATPPPSSEGAATWRTVVHVVDGDTIDLDKGERVRLIGVNTPETKHPQKPVEYFGREATEFARRSVEGKRVRLAFDWQRKDSAGERSGTSS